MDGRPYIFGGYMLNYLISTQKDMRMLMDIRLEMLREVNSLADDYVYDEKFVAESEKYFTSPSQTTILALDGDKAVGCATMCYLYMMPTFSHPTGIRAHLMNVYINKSYRRQGAAKIMLGILIEDAKARDATQINLDATEAGRPLYESMGFTPSAEYMAMNL